MVELCADLYDLAGPDRFRQTDAWVAETVTGRVWGTGASAFRHPDLLGRDEAPVPGALGGGFEEAAGARAHLERDRRLPVGWREQERALVGDGVVVQPDLDGPDEVVGLHRVVHRDLQRNGAGIFRQARALDHGSVLALRGRLRLRPT